MEERDLESGNRPDGIPEEGEQKPTLRFLNRYVRGSVGLKWHDLGVELLDFGDVEELDKIEAQYQSDLDKCCTKMFQLWLRKQPSATWNKLLDALRQPGIELHALANKIEQMLLQPKPEDQHKQPTPRDSEPQTSLVSVASLNADFASLLICIQRILSNTPTQQDNLEKCKKYCSTNLKVSDKSRQLVFSSEDIAKIKACTTFEELFDAIIGHLSWDEHSILTYIAKECNSVEAEEEIKKFDSKLALFEGMKMISSTSKQNFSKQFMKFCVIINKPYSNVTIQEFKKVKAYIFRNLETDSIVTVGFLALLYNSLHIEWLVTVQAVSHMIKKAKENKQIFINEKYIFMQIGTEVVIEDKDTLAQHLSTKQLFNLKQIPVKQRSKLTGSNEKATDEELLVMEHSRSCRKISLVPTDTKIKPAAVADEFSYVTEQITELLQSHDPKVIVEQCEAIMASDGIKLFSDKQIEQLNHYNNISLLLYKLSHLWSWSNHSMLRVLAGFSNESIKLLDEFYCRLDPLHPITSYPVLEIMPTDATSQTTLNVKFAKSVAKITLQDVFDICSLVVNHCGVTRYCLQLIATQHGQGCVTIYWSIPKCVVNLISSTVLQHSSKLYDMGVLEVAIYPDIKITTGNIAKPKEEASKISDLAKQLQHFRRKYNAVYDENKKLKEDQSVLLTCLKTREERVKELEEKDVKVEEDSEEKSTEIIVIPLQSKCIETLEKAVQTQNIDANDAQNSSESLLDQKLIQQNSEILLLKADYGTLKKRFEQLSGIHSKCKSQKEKVSIGIQTDDEDTHVQLHAITEDSKFQQLLQYVNGGHGSQLSSNIDILTMAKYYRDLRLFMKKAKQFLKLDSEYMRHQIDTMDEDSDVLDKYWTSEVVKEFKEESVEESVKELYSSVDDEILDAKMIPSTNDQGLAITEDQDIIQRIQSSVEMHRRYYGGSSLHYCQVTAATANHHGEVDKYPSVVYTCLQTGQYHYFCFYHHSLRCCPIHSTGHRRH